MITKDVAQYAQMQWPEHRVSITECSKSDQGSSLVKDDSIVYHFDAISHSLYRRKVKPSSADGLAITDKHVSLIEFKTGFMDHITKENFDVNKAKCDYIENEVCPGYFKLFEKKRKLEKKQLIDSVHLKAIESYITLEKHILPNCPDGGRKRKLVLVVVLDADPVDAMEDTLSGLATSQPKSESPKTPTPKTQPKKNAISSVRNALKFLCGQEDACGQPYYYDRIEVMSASDFRRRKKEFVQDAC